MGTPVYWDRLCVVPYCPISICSLVSGQTGTLLSAPQNGAYSLFLSGGEEVACVLQEYFKYSNTPEPPGVIFRKLHVSISKMESQVRWGLETDSSEPQVYLDRGEL